MTFLNVIKVLVNIFVYLAIFLSIFSLVICSERSRHSKSSCGRSLYHGPAQRVVGGRVAHVGEFPWTVSVHISGQFKCGGSIIDDFNILTAAHCLQGRSSADVSIRYNSLFFSMAGFQRNASRLIVHPNYNNRTIDNDIGIIRLKSKLIFNRLNSSPVCLPSKKIRLPEGSVLTVTGWGLTDRMSVSSILMAADVPLISLEKCRQQYKKLPEFYKITNNMICAGFDDGKVDACSGDSGGPLIRSVNGFVFQFGIVSKGFGCGSPMKAGVYTNVENFYDWIIRNTM